MAQEAPPADTGLALATLADALPSLIFVALPGGGNIYVNARYTAYTGFATGAVLGQGWRDIVHPDDLGHATARFVPGGTEIPFEHEMRLRSADGTYRWFLVRTTPVRTADGRISYWVGNAADIDQLRRAQDDLAAALAAKAALLYEVSHRVKNSLQLVTALLSLQAAQTREDDSRRAVTTARNRIAVVAGVHRRLYWDDGSDTVDIGAYLPGLVEETLTGNPRASLARFAFHAPVAVLLPVSAAVPLALILSELVCNAVTHGIRPDGGAVDVAVSGGERLVATVRDDGVGLPPGFNPRTAKSLGMRIVTALGRQAKANVEVVPVEKGTCFRVDMPIGGGRA